MDEKATQLYRVEFNGKYFWFASLLSEFSKALKMQISLISRYEKQRKNLTEIQGLMAAGKVKPDQVKFVNLGADTSQMKLAQMLVNDIKNFDSSQVYGQKIPLLAFYLKDYQVVDNQIVSDFDVRELLQLMNEYCQVDFGFPLSEEKYLDSLGFSENSDEYFRQRSLAWNYWLKENNYLRILSQAEMNRGNSSLLSHQAQTNYQEAYYRLRNSDVNPLWYEDVDSRTNGLIWHFTDANQAINILSDFRINLENQGEETSASHYLRFPLRPQTLEQYQKERILDRSAINANGPINNCSLSCAPIPVFICFSLKSILERGGLLTNGDKSQNDALLNLQKDIDYDLFALKENILSIYADRNSEKMLQTECLVKEFLQFTAKDIAKIYVRTEAEKVSLLTSLVDYQSKQNFKQKHLNLISVDRYADRIQVEPSLFFDDRGKINFVDNQIEVTQIDKSNVQYHEEPYAIVRELKTMSKFVTVDKLIRREFKVKDSHDRLTTVATFHKPDWILKVAKWKSSFTEEVRYYSDLYYQGEFLRVYRAEGEDEWFIKNQGDTKMDFTAEEQQILREVEESFKLKTTRKKRK